MKKTFEKGILIAGLWGGQAMAALPTAVAPSTAPATGDWLGLLKGYIKDGGLVIGLFIAIAAFLWLSWIVIADINEARNGKKEWGEVGLSAVVGAAGLLVISYFLGQAAGVI